MVPSQGCRRISPGNIGAERAARIPEVKYIPSEISAQINAVFFRKLVIHFNIQVIKIITGTIETT